jgi:hypothetical protein
MGSAVTYARRYALSAMIGIVADEGDDDGNAAAGRGSPQQQRRPETEGGVAKTGPATLQEMQQADRLIRERSKSKKWRDALAAFGVTPGEQWEEPAGPRDLTMMCEWVPGEVVRRIIATCEK